MEVDTKFSIGEMVYIIDEEKLSQDGKRIWDVKRNLGGAVKGRVQEILLYCKEGKIEERYVLSNGVDRIIAVDKLFKTEKEALERCTALNQITIEEIERNVVA